jgi:hypothetical protein
VNRHKLMSNKVFDVREIDKKFGSTVNLMEVEEEAGSREPEEENIETS